MLFDLFCVKLEKIILVFALKHKFSSANDPSW